LTLALDWRWMVRNTHDLESFRILQCELWRLYWLGICKNVQDSVNFPQGKSDMKPLKYLT